MKLTNPTQKHIGSGAGGGINRIYNNSVDIAVKYIMDYGHEYYGQYMRTFGNYSNFRECLCGMDIINKAYIFLPNFVYTYGFSFCDNTKTLVCDTKNIKSHSAPIFFYEFINAPNLKSFIRENINNEYLPYHLNLIIMQILNAFILLNNMFISFTHNDLHCGNILVIELEEEKSIPVFNFVDKKLESVKYIRVKYLVKIIDFAMASFFSFENNRYAYEIDDAWVYSNFYKSEDPKKDWERVVIENVQDFESLTANMFDIIIESISAEFGFEKINNEFFIEYISQKSLESEPSIYKNLISYVKLLRSIFKSDPLSTADYNHIMIFNNIFNYDEPLSYQEILRRLIYLTGFSNFYETSETPFNIKKLNCTLKN